MKSHFVGLRIDVTIKRTKLSIPTTLFIPYCHYNRQRALDHEGRVVGVAVLWG